MFETLCVMSFILPALLLLGLGFWFLLRLADKLTPPVVSSLPDFEQLKRERDVASLTALLDDERLLARRNAVFALGDLKAVEPLIEALLHSPDDEVRAHAASALGRVGDRRALAPLLQVWEREGPQLNLAMQAAVLSALGKVGDQRALKPLLAAIENNRLRTAAAGALAELGDARALDALLPYANDTSFWLAQVHILTAFQKFKDPRCVPFLIAVLENKESRDEVREKAEQVMLYFLEHIRFRDKEAAERAFAEHNRIECADCGGEFMWEEGWNYFSKNPLPGETRAWQQGIVRGSFTACPHCETMISVGEWQWRWVGENAVSNAGKAKPRRRRADPPLEI